MAEEKLPETEPNALFPSDLLDPKEKAKKGYSLQTCKATYNKYRLDAGFFSNARKFDYIENRTYAKGNQDVNKYKAKFTHLKDKQGKDVSYLNLDYRIVPVIPKFRDVVLSYMAKMDVDYFADSLNPKASDDRKNYKNQLWAKAILKPFYEELAIKAQHPELADQGNDYIPETKEELEMWMELGHRLPEETAMEVLIRSVFNENDWGEDASLVREDLFDNGVAFGSEYIDPISKKIRMQYEDPVNGIFQEFRGHNGTKGMSRIGVIRRLTIAQLKLSAGNQFTEEEYYDMARRFTGYFDNPSYINPLADWVNTDTTTPIYNEYDGYTVLVMDIEWDTSDRIKMETRTYPDGFERVIKKPFKTPLTDEEEVKEGDQTIYTRKVEAVDYKAIYGAKWVIGTDYIYDYGKEKNIERKCENGKDPQKRFKLYRVSTKSILERMCGYADSIQLAWLKMQNLKARAIPKGLIIDISAFENIMLDDKDISAKELLEMAVQTGIILYRSDSTLDDAGERVGKPIEETDGGIGAEFQELNNSILQDFQSIRELTGINSAMDASSPDPNTLVGTQKIAMAGAANALYPLLNGFVKFSEQMSSGICAHGLLLAKHGQLRAGYEASLGTALCEALETAAQNEDSPVQMGIRIEGRPTQEEKQSLLQLVETALASPLDPSKGGIELPDAIELRRLIINNTPPKLVEAILRYRINQSKKRLEQTAAANTKANADANDQAIQKKAEQDVALLRAKGEVEKDLYTHKTNEDIRKAEALHPLKVQEDIMKGEVKKDQDKEAAKLEATAAQ